MKIICDCGNKVELLETDKDTGEQNNYTPGEGLYVRLENDSVSFWQEHDVVGIACESCGKAIWLFC